MLCYVGPVIRLNVEWLQTPLLFLIWSTRYRATLPNVQYYNTGLSQTA